MEKLVILSIRELFPNHRDERSMVKVRCLIWARARLGCSPREGYFNGNLGFTPARILVLPFMLFVVNTRA
jgi:hypothetical protein